MKQTRGFTLIELLTVIAIIGILASIIMVNLLVARQKARDARRVSDIKNIQLALEQFYNANLYYPVSIYNNSSFTPTYMKSVPYDPNGTSPCTNGTQASCYTYASLNTTGAGTACASSKAYGYHLGATMEANSKVAQDDDTAADTADTCATSPDADFDGAAPNCTGVTAANGTADNCFDVSN